MKSIQFFIYLLGILFFFTGCLSNNLENFLINRISKTLPTHQEILTNSSLEYSIIQEDLSQKTLFISFFPLYLAQLGNFVENNIEHPYSIYKKRDKAFFYNENKAMIKQMLKNKDPLQRSSALEIIKYQKQEQNLDEVYFNGLNDSIPYVKIVALNNILDIPGNNLIIYKLLKDKNEIVRYETLRKLERIKNKKLLFYIYQCLNDQSPIVRAQSIKTLGAMGFVESIEYLWDLLNDPQPYVRRQAEIALKKLTGKDVGYNYSGSLEKRKKLMMLWRLWWKNKQKNIQLQLEENFIDD